MVARSLLARSSLVGRFATRHPDLTTSQHLTTVHTLFGFCLNSVFCLQYMCKMCTFAAEKGKHPPFAAYI